MAKDNVPPGISAKLEGLLMEAMPDNLNERQWCLRSQVSTSFFTDLRNGREPGIDRVERMANTAGLKLSELVEGVEAPPFRQPTVSELEAMVGEIVQAEVTLQTRLSDLPHIVATGLHEQLQHFQSGLASPADEGGTRVPGKVARSRAAKKGAEPAGSRKP